MATTYSTNLQLQKPAASDRRWDLALNANVDAIDALAPLGGLAVTTAEVPSASLSCRIAPGGYLKANGTIASFAGLASLAVAPNSTQYVWLTDAGVPAVGASFPTTPHVRLAQVQTSASTIMQVVDVRIAYRSAGSSALFVARAGDTIGGPLQVAPPQGGPAILAVDPTANTIGFFGAAAATQAPRLNPIADATGGTASDTVVDAGSSYSQAAINNNFAAVVAKVDALIATLKRHGLMSS